MTLDGRMDVAAPPRGGRVAVAAPLWRRFAAALVDSALAVSPLLVAEAIPVTGVPRGVLLFVAALCSVTVAIVNDIALVVRDGQSFGRHLLNIQVVDSHAMVPPNVGQVIFRNIVGWAGFGAAWHPFTFLPTFMVILSPWPIICYAPAVRDRRWHRGLNDRWAHTVVISIPPSHRGDRPAF